MNKMLLIAFATLLVQVSTACAGKIQNPDEREKTNTQETPKTEPPQVPSASSVLSLPPLYLTVVSHNEEPGQIHPDYIADRAFYLDNREMVRQLALLLKNKGAMLNFQSDWNYLKAVVQYDVGDVVSNTNGKNIVKWLVEDMGFEADPHAHETQYNYADVAYLHTQLGVTPSKNVGGFLYLPPDNIQGWEQHINGVSGKNYPFAFWKADTLWGAATFQHQGNDEQSYGVWRPKDRYNFTVDDPNQRLVNIGGGCWSGYGLNNPGIAGVRKILEAISAKEVPLDGFYTATIFIPQAPINSQMIEAISKDLDWLQPYVKQGRVIWSSLTQTVQTWKTAYKGKPFRLDCSQVS
jgi:hypothetical protein